MSLSIQTYNSEEELLSFLMGLCTAERWGNFDEELLHREWRELESWISDRMIGVPSWDYALMDWPSEIPLFNVVLNNQALQSDLHLEELQHFLAQQTLPWAVRIEWMDRIHGGTMHGGAKLKDCIVQQDSVQVWDTKES
jgi:hypothetical protein